MGSKCGTHPKAYTLNELTDLKINDKLASNKGCCPNIGGGQDGSGQSKCLAKGFSWPNNGEFDWGGLGPSCTMCSAIKGYGCACGSGIGGKRPRVKRTAYLGDHLKCCLSGGPTINNKTTCDPRYRGLQTNDCFNHLRKYCEGNDAFDDNCTKWGASSDTALNTLNAAKKIYCNNISKFTKSSDCRAWCASSGKGECDEAANAYCAIHIHDPICNCINSPLDTPQCGDMDMTKYSSDVHEAVSSCRNSGYWTSNMNTMVTEGRCPTIVECKQDWNVGGSKNVLHNNIQVQVCGGDGEDSDVERVKKIFEDGKVGGGGGTTAIPGTDIELPRIPGLPEEDIISGIPNTLLVILILIVVLVFASQSDENPIYPPPRTNIFQT